MKGVKTWWGIRHLRYFWLRRKLRKWVEYWRRQGVGIFVHPLDAMHLKKIWKGTENDDDGIDPDRVSFRRGGGRLSRAVDDMGRGRVDDYPPPPMPL